MSPASGPGVPVADPAPVRTERSGPARRRRPLTKAQMWGLRITSVVAILLVWEAYGRSVNPILFTYPAAIAVAFVDMIRDGSLIDALRESMLVLIVGFLIGSVAGVLIGLLAGRNQVVAALIELPVNALYSTPSVALIPVLVLWFGFGVQAKIVIVTLFVIFPMLINTMRGVQEVDRDLIEVARAFCSSERRMWADLIFPSALPYIVTGLRLSIGRALIGVIVAEFFTAFAGLGYLIVTNANRFQTDRVFVPIVVLAALGVGLTATLEWLEGRVARWRAAT